jgi:hypothetical protein
MAGDNAGGKYLVGLKKLNDLNLIDKVYEKY